MPRPRNTPTAGAIALLGLLICFTGTGASAAEEVKHGAGAPTPPASPRDDPAGPGSDARPSRDPLLDRMEAAYSDLHTYRADFVQESVARSIGRRKTSRGEVFFEKPNRMRWRYQEPERRDIYLQGERIVVHLPAQDLVLLQSLGSATSGTAPAQLFMGPRELARSFEMSWVPPPSPEPDTRCLRLVPRERGSMSVEEVLLWVGKDDFLPVRTESVDLLGNRTTIRFRNAETGVKLDAGLFEFEIPDDAEVMDGGF